LKVFTITNKNEYSVLLERDGSGVETLLAGQTSSNHSETGVYQVVPLHPLPEPLLSANILAEVTVTRLIGAPDNTYTTKRSNVGDILVEIKFEGELEA